MSAGHIITWIGQDTSAYIRIQIEEDITEIEELLNILNELDWKDSDIDNWVGMKWP